MLNLCSNPRRGTLNYFLISLWAEPKKTFRLAENKQQHNNQVNKNAIKSKKYIAKGQVQVQVYLSIYLCVCLCVCAWPLWHAPHAMKATCHRQISDKTRQDKTRRRTCRTIKQAIKTTEHNKNYILFYFSMLCGCSSTFTHGCCCYCCCKNSTFLNT